MKPEENLKRAISGYLRLRYPHVIYRFDIAADIPLTVGQARKSKSLHMHERGYPDLFVAYPNGGYCGLFLELKAAGTVLRTKKGTWRTPHLREQARMLERLRDVGYCAGFVVGLDDVRMTIDAYLSAGICPFRDLIFDNSLIAP